MDSNFNKPDMILNDNLYIFQSESTEDMEARKESDRKESKKLKGSVSAWINVVDQGFGIFYENENIPKFYGPLNPGEKKIESEIQVAVFTAKYALSRGCTRVDLKTTSVVLERILSHWEEEWKDAWKNPAKSLMLRLRSAVSALDEVRQKIKLGCTLVQAGEEPQMRLVEKITWKWPVPNDNFYSMREFNLNLLFSQDPPTLTEVHLQPTLLRSAGTYVVARPNQISIRARPDAPPSVLEKLKKSKKKVKVIASDQSPFCAVRTSSSLDKNKTVFVKAHCGRNTEFEGTKIVLLEGIVVGMGFAAAIACCDQGKSSKDCQCEFSDINYLFWTEDEKRQQEEVLKSF